jgi:peroxiredoxin
MKTSRAIESTPRPLAESLRFNRVACHSDSIAQRRGWSTASAAAAGLIAAFAVLSSASVQAQSPKPAASTAAGASTADATPYQLQGTQLDGQAFSVAQLRGKVVMVFYWSTACSVCLSKMPELRANALGWKGKPFELVLVSVDKSRADTLAYQLALNTTGAADAKTPSLWVGDPGFMDTLGGKSVKPPLSLVLDTKGKVVARYEGRIAPEAWNAIADLIP